MNADAIVRVFPRSTKATPADENVFIGEPDMFTPGGATEIHVSCTFTWDKGRCERLAEAWQRRFPEASVRLGGPAFGDPGGEFEPGLYLREGYVITSRGCPNNCELCLVPRREGKLRLLEVRDGWNVLDNNLLACPHSHVSKVLRMLLCQQQRPCFSGGLEAARFDCQIAREILSVRPERLYFAYDHPHSPRHVASPIGIIREITRWRAGTLRHHVGCYVLVGYPGDTVHAAEQRCRWVIDQNVRCYPMYYRDESYSRRPPEWHDLIGGLMTWGGNL